MASRARRRPPVEVEPLTKNRWSDLAAVFDRRGGCGNCWCMFWRLRGSEFDRMSARAKRRALKGLIDGGSQAGLLAYADGKPIGWCAVAPRHEYARLERSPALKRVDGQPVWAIVCFYIVPEYRRRGVATRLLRAAIDFARESGAPGIEGYPIDHKSGRLLDRPPYMGTPVMFSRLRFREVARRRPTRPLMRRRLRRRRTRSGRE